jgi:hypothetical protein
MLAAASAGISAVGDVMAGEAESAAAKYNSATGFANAAVVRENTVAQATQQARENYLRLGDMRASIGKSGGTGGSFLDVLADTAAQGELAKQNIIYAGSVKANNLVRGALLDQTQATTAKIGGYFKAGADLIGAGNSFNKLSRAGGSGGSSVGAGAGPG